MLKTIRKARLLAFIAAVAILVASALTPAFGVADVVFIEDIEAPLASGAAEPADEPGADGEPADGPAAEEPPDFSDLSASYADLTQLEKAEILNRLGVLLGDPDRGLMLDIKVRRSDAAVFFTRLLGREQYVKDRAETDFATSRFPDAPEGMWYTPYISYCTSIGLLAGRTDGFYYPDDNISEKEFANVLLKILGYEYELDYFWDTVYEFSYDIGLFDDPAYATRTEDNREYFRRDVCDQVFAVLGLEKKDSPKLLIEELIENGAISERIAADLGFDLSGLSYPGSYDVGYYPADADIYEVYHLEPDLLWVIFTKPVTFRDEAVEICQTYDYSRILSARVEEKTGCDMLLRTGEQQPDMDYTIDISNVLEPDGTNAGMLSFDFIGFIPGAPDDAPGGLTTLVRDVNALPGPAGAANIKNPQGSGEPDVIGGIGDGPDPNGGTASSNTGSSGGGAGASSGSSWPSGNADPSAEYFRIINAYTTASNELVVYFSHPISETALNPAFYNIIQGSTIMGSGSAGQIRAELMENTVNAVCLTVSGLTFTRGSHYRVAISGRLISSYTARLNEGSEDSYTFTADNVAARSDNFNVTSIETVSQYGVEIEFTQSLNAEVARQAFNYLVLDNNGRKVEIASINLLQGAVSAGANTAPGGKVVRVNLSQPLLTRQDCTMTIVYAQNAAQTASIANQSYTFQYGGQTESAKKSTIAMTGAISNDPSSVELYFSQKLDPASAVILSNYSIGGQFEGSSNTVNPVKVSYDSNLTPYMVRLYLPSDRRFLKDRPYTVRISNSIRDEKKLNPDRVMEMQFFANNRDQVNPVVKEAVIVGEGIVRLSFSKEIMFDPTRLSEGNFKLTDMDAGGGVQSMDAQLTPLLVKYIDSTTVILRFDYIDMARRYNAQFESMTDFSGQYTTRYPEQGSSAPLRNGRK